MRNTWLDSKLLAEKIATRYKELMVEAVRRELQFISILEGIDKDLNTLEYLDKEQQKTDSEDTTIEQT